MICVSESVGWSAYEDGDAPAASYQGQLLLAMPMLTDGPFRRAVVLILDHDADGALGVILNRPLDAEVRDVLPDWGAVATEPDSVYEGGPVATDSALAVGVLRRSVDDVPLGWRAMFGRVGLVDLDVPVQTVERAVVGIRVFAGYAGWEPGQLEDEIEAGAWIVVDSVEDDLVATNPWALWRDVLRRQGGDLSLIATYPDEPSHN